MNNLSEYNSFRERLRNVLIFLFCYLLFLYINTKLFLSKSAINRMYVKKCKYLKNEMLMNSVMRKALLMKNKSIFTHEI